MRLDNFKTLYYRSNEHRMNQHRIGFDVTTFNSAFVIIGHDIGKYLHVPICASIMYVTRSKPIYGKGYGFTLKAIVFVQEWK